MISLCVESLTMKTRRVVLADLVTLYSRCVEERGLFLGWADCKKSVFYQPVGLHIQKGNGGKESRALCV